MVKNGLLCVMLILARAHGAGPVLSDPKLLTNGFQLRLMGESSRAYLIERSHDLTNWTPVVISTERQSVRTVVAPAGNFMQAYRARVVNGFGIWARSSFDVNRHAFASDSFDSSDPAFSTGGQYDPAKRLDGGDAAAYSLLTNGGPNLKIRGKLWMGPNGVTHGLAGPDVSIGSGAWVDAGRTGVQPGFLLRNLSTDLADAPPAPIGGFSGFPGGATIYGEVYDHVLMSGVYRINGAYLLSGSKRIYVQGDVKIYFSGGLTISGVALIRLGPAAGAEMWSGGAVQLGGQGVQGVTRADQFVMYGLPTCTNISITVSTLTGLIYAPSAHCVLGPTMVTGSCIAETVTLAGPVSVHFDEALRASGAFW